MTYVLPTSLAISRASELETVRTPQPDHDGRSTPTLDSGYASLSATTNNTSQCDQGELVFPTRKFFKRKTKLKVFKEEIPTHVRDRFLDLQELFDRPLYERLVKSGKNFGRISSKLKRLGESERTSAYWLVVQCEPKIARRVKQFFDQDHVKSEYQPSNASEDLPWFNIWICPEPPIRLAMDCEVDEGIYVDLKECTLSGTLVKMPGRIATIGGVIMVKAQRRDLLYCLTAGHIISTPGSSASVRDARDEEEQGLSDVESEDSLSDDFELDSGLSDDTAKGQVLGISKECILRPRPVRFVEETQHKTKRCFDWALATLNLTEAFLYRPNCRMRANGDDEDGVAATTVELRETDRRSTRLPVSRRVVALGGVSGLKFGILSESPSFYMSAPATKFAQMYTLTLTAGSSEADFESANQGDANILTALETGDCGSWIVDEATNEVYGHVVASDVFGEVYVAPLKETLKQIEEVLGADSVSLPTRSEVAAWIKKHQSPQRGPYPSDSGYSSLQYGPEIDIGTADIQDKRQKEHPKFYFSPVQRDTSHVEIPKGISRGKAKSIVSALLRRRR
ncbi:MAG: hypothetical protein LQ351_007924 [Letrouitia transgressa]|nr:MAG: hypothetical protein LQ351_007924 [Letrouitia transgressa]